MSPTPNSNPFMTVSKRPAGGWPASSQCCFARIRFEDHLPAVSVRARYQHHESFTAAPSTNLTAWTPALLTHPLVTHTLLLTSPRTCPPAIMDSPLLPQTSEFRSIISSSYVPGYNCTNPSSQCTNQQPQMRTFKVPASTNVSSVNLAPGGDAGLTMLWDTGAYGVFQVDSYTFSAYNAGFQVGRMQWMGTLPCLSTHPLSPTYPTPGPDVLWPCAHARARARTPPPHTHTHTHTHAHIFAHNPRHTACDGIRNPCKTHKLALCQARLNDLQGQGGFQIQNCPPQYTWSVCGQGNFGGNDNPFPQNVCNYVSGFAGSAVEPSPQPCGPLVHVDWWEARAAQEPAHKPCNAESVAVCRPTHRNPESDTALWPSRLAPCSLD